LFQERNGNLFQATRICSAQKVLIRIGWLHIILDIDDMHAHGSKYKYTLNIFSEDQNENDGKKKDDDDKFTFLVIIVCVGSLTVLLAVFLVAFCLRYKLNLNCDQVFIFTY
jgi:hypothetical protein